MLSSYAATLDGLRRKARLRVLAPRRKVDFTSNDFLALAQAPRLKAALIAAIERGVPVGAGGSRLLHGNHTEHEALETEAAKFFGAERVLYFGSGYAANSALFSTLPQRGDVIVYDALIHASAHEGIANSKAAAISVAHNDAQAFADALHQWRKSGGTGHPWIAVESLYSMDGDRAPLADLAEIADRYEGFLVIDEAHATGVYGKDGRGLATGLDGRENVITLHTCGKALGVSGALLAAPRVLNEYLINRARAFIYSTAPSPLMAACVREALRIVADEPQRRATLAQYVTRLATGLHNRLGIEPSGSQIQPVMIGDNARAMRIADCLQSREMDIRAIRPPTVPEGSARLRLTITCNLATQDIDRLLDWLVEIIGETAP